METNEKEKSEEPSVGRRILGVAVAGAVAVAGGAFFLLSAAGNSTDQEEKADHPPAQQRKTMKAPGSGGEIVYRDRFKEDPQNYFSTQRRMGPKAAVDRFQ